MEQNLNTDTHLSKDFNKVLQSCMIQANLSHINLVSSPHYLNLIPYYSAVECFFINTFYLFSNLKYKFSDGTEKRLDLALEDTMFQIQDKINSIKYNSTEPPTIEDFNFLMNKCKLAHMMIMSGLNKRNMLVRQSEKEPRGVDSIGYWQEKLMFKKGDLHYKKVSKNEQRAVM